MATLLRSSTTRADKRQPNATVDPRGLRLRSSSFTQSPLRKQKSESHFNHSSSVRPIVTRRPSFDSGANVSSRRPSPSPLGHDAHTTQQATSSRLTVADLHSGGASSIDTGSEDEEDAEPSPPGGQYALGEHISSPVSISSSDGHEMGQAASMSSGQRSLTTSLKDKLSLSRNPGLKRQRSLFRFGRAPVEQQPHLYDDGSQHVYPPPPLPDDQSVTPERDQYGFVKSSQWLTLADHAQFEHMYQPIIARRLQKWRQLLVEHHGQWPAKSSKIKRYVRKGIPQELRRQAWLHFSGAKAKMESNPGVYQAYVLRAQVLGHENEHLDIIERDLHRTFPDNERFKSTHSPNGTVETDAPAICALRRLLSAFSLYAPNIGYCQSLNYIAGLLILFMEEEEAFWTFTVIIQDILPPNIYDVTMEGANIDQTVLMMLLSERCPQIWNKLSGGKSFWECEEASGNGMPTVSLVTSHWFLTLFINILPIESILRVWDCFFFEGQRALFRVALAIFKMNEDKILAVDDPLEIFQVVQNMPKRMIDCHKLIDVTYNKYASLTRITDQDLEKRQALIRSRREERRKAGTEQEGKLKRGKVRGTIIHKAKSARRLVERAKTVRR